MSLPNVNPSLPFAFLKEVPSPINLADAFLIDGAVNLFVKGETSRVQQLYPGIQPHIIRDIVTANVKMQFDMLIRRCIMKFWSHQAPLPTKRQEPTAFTIETSPTATNRARPSTTSGGDMGGREAREHSSDSLETEDIDEFEEQDVDTGSGGGTPDQPVNLADIVVTQDLDF